MDCGWQNLARAPSNCQECLKSLTSSEDCIGYAAHPNGTWGVQSPFAMLTSSQLTSAKILLLSECFGDQVLSIRFAADSAFGRGAHNSSA